MAPIEWTPKKVRLLVVDDARGSSAPGVVLQAIAEYTAPRPNVVRLKSAQGTPAGTASRQRSLGVLATDHTGYASFDLQPLESGPRPTHLWITPIARPEARVDVLPILSVAVEDPVVLRIEGAHNLQVHENALPAVQRADADDWAISPRSFAAEAVVSLGEGECATLMMSNAPTQSYRFEQVIREPAEKDLRLQPIAASTCSEPADGKAGPPVSAVCYRNGVLIEYEVRWIPAGHGVGELLYSLPLAPCETVRLAVVDWTRADAVVRTDEVGVEEQLLHEQRRDRAIDETMQGMVSEWQRGGAVMGAVAGAYSSGTVSVTGSLGAGYSTSSGDRNVAAATAQRIADGVRQASNASRRLQSTVVVQATQRETERLATRSVTNHNHCHALTILYFEVVRHFRVETAVARARNAILLRHPEQSFDRARVGRDHAIIGKLLLDATLRPALENLARRGGEARPEPSRAPRYGNEIRRLIVRVTTGDTDPGQWPSDGGIDLLLLDSAGKEQSFDLGEREFWDSAAQRHGDVPIRAGQTNTFLVSLDIPLRSLSQIGIHYWRHGESRWALRGLEILASVTVDRGMGEQSELLRIFHDPAIDRFFNDDGEWWSDVRLPEHVAQVDSAAESAGEEAGVSALLDHLNAHRDYYNRALWLSEDPNRRARLFERFGFSRRGQRGRLADFIENRPVDVVGEYVVYPLAGEDLGEKLVPELPATEAQILSLPTRGAFAEVKLSHCNACEVIDDTRFWEWQQSPCGCEGPEIAPISAGSRARDPDATPSSPPSGTLTVGDPLAAPDPTGLAHMLELLGKSDVFRDMSGRAELAGVMQSLVNGAVQLSVERMRQNSAQRQQSQSGQGSSSPSTGGTSRPTSGTGASGQSSAASARSQELTRQLARSAVDQGVRSGALSRAEGADYRRRLVDAQVENAVASERAAAAGGHGPSTGGASGLLARTLARHPLARYLRSRIEGALEFAARQFLAHRVTALGEMHMVVSSAFTGYDENVCVRLFVRDLVLHLCRSPEARLRFLVLEVDEAHVESVAGPLSAVSFPPGTVNRKAFWFAQSMSEEDNGALRTALLAISRECDDSRLEVVGIDDRSVIGDHTSVQDWLNARDLAPTPGESEAAYNARLAAEMDRRAVEFERQLDARDDSAFRNFRDRVMARLGDGRALVLYGMDHLAEAEVNLPSPGERFTNFVRLLQRSPSVVAPDDFYSMVTVWEGTGLDSRGMMRLNVDARATLGRRHMVPALVGIYDILRAEFPQLNLGFDLDDAQREVPLPFTSARYLLAEGYDGCLYFRDLNSWNGIARGGRETGRAEPPLRVTSVVPATAARQGGVVLLYGHQFVAGVPVRVAVHGERATRVELVNENLLAVEIPPIMDLDPPPGYTVDVTVSREIRPADGMLREQEFTLPHGVGF